MDFKERFFRNLTKNWSNLFFKTGIPAEFLTVFRFLFGILTAFFLLKGNYFYSIAFLLIYQFVFLLDYVDGELARKQRRFSIKWLYIDRIFHYITTILFLTSLAILTKNMTWILWAFFSSLAFSLTGIIDTRNSDKRLGKDVKERKIDKYENITGLLLIESPFSLFFFLVLFKLNIIAIILYSSFYSFGFAYKLLKLFKMKKTKEEIKKELSEQYFGEESQKYDEVRSEDPRRAYIVKKQSEITKSFLENENCKNILDVACGTGRFFYIYPGKIHGIDMSSDQLKEAHKKDKTAVLKVCDAENICYPSEKFDVAITSQFIMHIPEYEKVVSEMARVTKKGGSIIIDFPNKYSLTYPMTKSKIMLGKLRHYNLFSLKKIREMAKKNNLEIERIEPTVVITPMLFPKSLLKMSSSINKTLTKFFPNRTYVYYVKFRKL
ncbi:MAG: methyltransferase domain-containing protein [archaeon]|nr:methyltransferase domain-containing protein [archaeon]